METILGIIFMAIAIILFMISAVAGEVLPFLLAMFFGLIGLYLYYTPNNKSKSLYYYKVKELEKNTVFTITDSIGKYDTSDTVWVNMTTRKIDTQDTIAMLCVIVKEIK